MHKFIDWLEKHSYIGIMLGLLGILLIILGGVIAISNPGAKLVGKVFIAAIVSCFVGIVSIFLPALLPDRKTKIKYKKTKNK